MRRVLVVSFLALGGLSRAQAPSAAVLGRDDLAFALHLVRSGQPDLADGVCRVLLGSKECEAIVLDHTARTRALSDIDQAAVRAAVSACERRYPGPKDRRNSLAPVGIMLYDAGRRLLRVPFDVSGFLYWDGDATRAAELWSDAATLLQAARELGDHDGALPTLARLYRLFGNPVEASQLYEEMFRREQLIEGAPLPVREWRQGKPHLVEAYLEWGVLQRKLAAADEGDPASAPAQDLRERRKRFAPCIKVFHNLTQALDHGNAVWWVSKREEITTFLDLGDKKTAGLAFRSVERTTDPELMKQYGFDALRERLR